MTISPTSVRAALALLVAVCAVLVTGCGSPTDNRGEDVVDEQVVADPAWSPDGSQIAFSACAFRPFCRTSGIYVVRPDGSGLTRLSPKGLDAAGPRWSPDGRRILFVTHTSDLAITPRREIYVMAADGSQPRRLTRNRADDTMAQWSPDGRRIAFVSDRSGTFDVYSMAPDGSDLRRLTHTPQDERFPSWSPDGRWIAYVRGSDDIFLHGRKTPGPDVWITDERGRSRPLTTDHESGKDELAWSPKAATIAFGDGVTLLDLSTGTRRRLTDLGAVWALAWDADGRRLAFSITVPPPDDAFMAMDLYVYDTTLKKLERLGGGCCEMSWDPRGTRFVFAGMEHVVLVDVETGNRRDLPVPLP